MSKKWAEIVARSWIDEEFKKELLAHPQKVLNSYGIKTKGKKFRIVENTSDITFEILPKSMRFAPPKIPAIRVTPTQTTFPDDSLFLRHLKFENPQQERTIRRQCASSITPAQKTLGELYAKELAAGHIETATLKWIDEKIGYGAFAEREIPPLTYIAEYTGVVLGEEACLSRDNRYFCRYPIPGDSLYFVDAREHGNISRFINHSDNPNLELLFAFYDGLIHPFLRSSKKIRKGAQFSYNYGAHYWKRLSFKS